MFLFGLWVLFRVIPPIESKLTVKTKGDSQEANENVE